MTNQVDQELDELPDGYKVLIKSHTRAGERVELHTQYETLLYTAQGAQQLGKALIEAGEKLEERQDG